MSEKNKLSETTSISSATWKLQPRRSLNANKNMNINDIQTDANLEVPESERNQQNLIETDETDNSENQVNEKDEENLSINNDENSNSDVNSETEDTVENPKQTSEILVNNREILDENNQTTVLNSSNYIYKSTTITANKENLCCISVLVLLFAFCVPLLIMSIASQEKEQMVDLEALKEQFPTQDEFLWLAFESGVKDVVTLKRPSSFILLYKEESQNNLDKLVEKLAEYAACSITACSKQPIIITDALLNSSEIVGDYGIMIDRYRNQLKDKGVMIIKNLENVKGVSAQAFHSFCDEFTPLVDKSLFIFTMKVEELPGDNNKMRFVEGYFKSKWTDIKLDTLNALITRISSMVIEVNP